LKKEKSNIHLKGKKTEKKAVVVGSGIAGIASALRLRAQGFDVTILEKNNYFGGKLTVFEKGGFRFDAGPSLFTMPHFVEELFELFEEKPTDSFEYIKHHTACHYFFEDGTFLPFSSDEKTLLNTVSETLNIDYKPLQRHFKRSKKIYDASAEAFLHRSLHKFSSYLSKDILNCIAHIPQLHLFTTMHKVNQQKLNHPKLVQIFDRYATYNGSNPYQAPGILTIIPHLEHGFGTFFPKKGMHSITTSLIQLGERKGIKFLANQEVTEICVKNEVVTGVETKDHFIPSDIVICNSDIKPAYNYLIPKVKAPKHALTQEPSSSALIFYWGMKKQFPTLDLHSIFFSEKYKEEFEEIFKYKNVIDDPTVYIHVSSKLLPTDAPKDKESWFVMVNVPSNSGQNWTEIRQRTRRNILLKLSRMLGEDIESLIEVEDYLDPVLIEKRTKSFGGALYGSSSNERMAAFFRHPNFSKIKGLFFVGGSVHPGGGIPLCLLSAKIVSDLVEKENR
jgi:diapolycopene oxygenase